jgi:hypothetical protein
LTMQSCAWPTAGANTFRAAVAIASAKDVLFIGPFPSPTGGIAECTENDGEGAKNR